MIGGDAGRLKYALGDQKTEFDRFIDGILSDAVMKCVRFRLNWSRHITQT